MSKINNQTAYEEQLEAIASSNCQPELKIRCVEILEYLDYIYQYPKFISCGNNVTSWIIVESFNNFYRLCINDDGSIDLRNDKSGHVLYDNVSRDYYKLAAVMRDDAFYQ